MGWKLGAELERAIRKGSETYEYVVVSMDLDEALRPLVEWHRMGTPKLDSFRLGWVAFFAFGGLRLSRLDVDLIHAVGPVPVVPNRVDVNTVTFCHAAFDEATAGNPLKASASTVAWRQGQKFTLALERWWFRRRVRVLIAISPGSADDLRVHYPGVKVATIPRGIDVGRFRPDDSGRRRIREKHSVGDDDVVALFVDQQHRPIKGLRLAIEGFAAARSAGTAPDLLWVVGEGNEAHASVARELGVGARVKFMGRVSRMEDVYRAADIFVLPTVYEAFCRAAHEAAACELPVVAPPVNGIRELVGDNEAGMIARRDAADLARALGALARDRDLRARMGAVGRSRVLGFDQDAVASEIISLHESLLGAARAERRRGPGLTLPRRGRRA